MSNLHSVFRVHLQKTLDIPAKEADMLLRRYSAPSFFAQCSFCNGYYGRNHGEPLCSTCHLYTLAPPCELIPSCPFLKRYGSEKSDSEDSGNEDIGPDQDDSFTSSLQHSEADPTVSGAGGRDPPADDEGDMAEPILADILIPPGDGPPIRDGLYQRVQSLSSYSPQELLLCGEWLERNLPPEVLNRILYFLDDLSLWCCSQVSKRWLELVQTQTTARGWERWVSVRFPFFRPLVSPLCWFSIYGKLVKSTPCVKCLQSFIDPNNIAGEPFTGQYCCRRLASELRMIQQDPPEGIEARPINQKGSRWVASIIGPAGSPYEGGKFFLSLDIPTNYPIRPPAIRFLTKIFHPNISRHGDIGLDILSHQWIPALTIAKLVLCVQSILTDPNPKICMEPEIGTLAQDRPLVFNAIAKMWTWRYAKIGRAHV